MHRVSADYLPGLSAFGHAIFRMATASHSRYDSAGREVLRKVPDSEESNYVPVNRDDAFGGTGYQRIEEQQGGIQYGW